MTCSDEEIYYVYALIVQGMRKPFYVGKGKCSRVYEHLKFADCNEHKNNTIKKAIREGKRIRIRYLAREISEKRAFELERAYIFQYGRRDLGTGCLTNLTNGGEGVVGAVRTEDHKRKLARANLGKTASIETRAKMRASREGRSHKKETRLKIGKSQEGKTIPADQRYKIAIGKASKLDVDSVLTITELLKSGARGVDIAERFGVTPSTISDIRRGRRWTSVTGISKSGRS